MGANQCCESNKNLRANNHNNNIPNSKKRDREYTPPGNYQRNNIETDEPGNQQNPVKITSSVNNSNSRVNSPHSSLTKKKATPKNQDTISDYVPKFVLKDSFKAHDKIIVSMIELDNKKIATGSYDCTIKIWDLSNNNCEIIIKEEGRVFALLEFEPNMLLSAIDKTADNIQDINLINPDDIMINLWDLNNPKKNLHSFKGHQLRVNSLVKCGNKHFASCSNDGDIIIWDYILKKDVCTLRGHSDCILCMIKLNDGHLCSGSADKTIQIWDWEKQKCIKKLEENTNWIKCLCQLNNDKEYIISGTQDNNILVWDKDQCIQKLPGHTRSVRSICQIDNTNYIATASFDHNIKIWDLNDFRCIQTLTGHKSSVIDVIYHSDGYLVSCSNDLTIKIWKNN